MHLNNDVEFKKALHGLDIHQQRHICVTFVESVLPLCKDFRVSAAVATAKRPGVSDAELESAYHAVNNARIDSFTQCGRETDWHAQAGHFVAKAALNCVKPAESGVNLAWEAAMSVRMARTCEMVAEGSGTANQEAENQYRILCDFLNR